MSIKKKGDVLKNIVRRTKIVNGKAYSVYDVYFGTDHTGRKIRTSKPSEKEARHAIETFYAQYRETGSSSVKALSQKEMYEFSESRRILIENKIDVPLQDIVREYVRTAGGITKKSLAEAYSEYYDSFSVEQAVHKECILRRVGRWVTAYGAMNLCSDVSSQDMAEYIQSVFKDSPVKTRNNHVGYIKSFFEWCANPMRRYVAQNPMKEMALQKTAYKEPEYMKAHDVDTLFDILRSKSEELVIYATLSWFCGIRNAEIGRLSFGDVKLDDGLIRISRPKGWTQGIMPRVVHIPENAYKWLAQHNVNKHVDNLHDYDNVRRRIFRLGQNQGLFMPQNAGRHSFITHHAAAYGEPAKTEAIAGTSQRMRIFHYQGLVSRKDGERYFAIVP